MFEEKIKIKSEYKLRDCERGEEDWSQQNRSQEAI
jgi:hypothetical protein